MSGSPLLALALMVGLGAMALARPPTAGASTVELVGTTVIYDAVPGEENVVTMSFASGVVTIIEAAPNTITVSPFSAPGCTEDPVNNRVSCLSSGIIEAFLRDMNDAFTMTTSVPDVIGQPAPLIVHGGGGADTLFGGPGAESLSGNAGVDRVFAGAGDDVLEPDSEAPDGGDVINGGPGRDRLDYSHRKGPLSITLDDLPGDGEAGEQDNVASDVEDATGGSGGDVLVGSALNNALDGGPGDDTLSGQGGRDLLVGGAGDPGSDTLDGGDDDDTGSGGPGDDALFGRSGADSLDGGGGADSLEGDGGNDSLLGGAGLDSLRGGVGDDTVRGGAPALVGADRDDLLKGDDGNDRLIGDAGDDTLDGGLGADAISGGADEDTADYRSRFEPVEVTFDDLPNDGAPGEGDNVASDVENILGGRFNDTLTGDLRPNKLEGGGGEDYAEGGGRPDELSGDDSGDVLRTRDGARDSIACGDGRDFVVADARDVAVGDCEGVDDGRRRRPTRGKTAIVRPVKGIAGMSPRGIRRFVPLKDRVNLPLASRIDARKGQVALTATGRRRSRLRRASFTAGVFQILQRRARRAATNIVLKGGSFRRCRSGASQAGDDAGAARRRLSHRVVRRLRGSARGRFRTRGRYAAATVRGTDWEIIDRCDGTLTRVMRGRVVVRDFRRKRNIIVRAGRSYLARAR